MAVLARQSFPSSDRNCHGDGGDRPAGSDFFWAVWATAAAFGCYFCMYAFRKPFTAATFAGSSVGGIGFTTILVTSQVAGYTISKFLGIKIISEMPRQRRAISIMALILFAEAALVMFAFIPRPWNAASMMLNGLMLGMVFGLVLGTLEGRRVTEALTAGLCASFILADGVTKSVGAWLLEHQVTEEWMPAIAGSLFLLPLAICVAMLSQVPPPSDRDIAVRNERPPMDRRQRWSFVRRHLWGLAPLTIMYLMVTIVRSIRSDYAQEIWMGLGSRAVPTTFSNSEIWVVMGVLIANGAAVVISDNRQAFFLSLATCGLGFSLLAATLVARNHGLLEKFPFMVLIGLGLYLPYVAIHTTVFERMLAMTRERGNIGFLMYVVDSIGYLGFVAVMLIHNFGPRSHDLVGLLTTACWTSVLVSAVCLVVCWRYFQRVSATSAILESREELA